MSTAMTTRPWHHLFQAMIKISAEHWMTNRARTRAHESCVVVRIATSLKIGRTPGKQHAQADQ